MLSSTLSGCPQKHMEIKTLFLFFFFFLPWHISFHRMAQRCDSQNTEMQPLIFLLPFVSVSVNMTPGGEQKSSSTCNAKK